MIAVIASRSSTLTRRELTINPAANATSETPIPARTHGWLIPIRFESGLHATTIANPVVIENAPFACKERLRNIDFSDHAAIFSSSSFGPRDEWRRHVTLNQPIRSTMGSSTLDISLTITSKVSEYS
jgi:hypothetical protein